MTMHPLFYGLFPSNEEESPDTVEWRSG